MEWVSLSLYKRSPLSSTLCDSWFLISRLSPLGDGRLCHQAVFFMLLLLHCFRQESSPRKLTFAECEIANSSVHTCLATGFSYTMIVRAQPVGHKWLIDPSSSSLNFSLKGDLSGSFVLVKSFIRMQGSMWPTGWYMRPRQFDLMQRQLSIGMDYDSY